MDIIGWVLTGIVAFNVVFFGGLAINDYFERRRRK